MPGEPQLIAQRHQVVEAVARADQGEGDVVAAELVHDDVGGPHHDVDAVLRAHDADVGGQEPAAPAQVGVRLAAPQPLGVGSGADDGDVRGALAAPGDGDVPVGVVGGDHVVRGPVGPALQRPQAPVGQRRAVREAGLVQLGAQVVVVEDEPGAVDGPQGQGDRPEDVRRVAGLHDREPAGPPRLERQPGRRQEGVDVLGKETELAAAGRVRPVLVQLHPVDDLVGGVPVPFGHTTATW